MLDLSSGAGRGRAHDHRRAGRRDRHHDPAHPLAADARPAPPPGTARAHRPLRLGAPGPAHSHFAPAGARASRSSRSASSSTPCGPADRSPASSGSPSLRHRPAARRRRDGLGRALRLRRAPAHHRGTADRDGRFSRWFRPPCGTSRLPDGFRPGGAQLGRVRSVGSRTVPDPPAVPLLRWDGARDLGADVAVTTRHGGAFGRPLRLTEPRPPRRRRPRDGGPQPVPGGRELRGRARCVGRRPPGSRRRRGHRRPGPSGPRHAVRGRRHSRHRHPRHHVARASRWPSWWPTASRSRWSTPRRVSWPPSMPAGAARPAGPSATP